MILFLLEHGHIIGPLLLAGGLAALRLIAANDRIDQITDDTGCRCGTPTEGRR